MAQNYKTQNISPKQYPKPQVQKYEAQKEFQPASLKTYKGNKSDFKHCVQNRESPRANKKT